MYKAISSVYRFQIDIKKEKIETSISSKFIRILQSTWNVDSSGNLVRVWWWLGAARSISWYNDLESSIRAGVVDVRRASDELPRSRVFPRDLHRIFSRRYRSRDRIFHPWISHSKVNDIIFPPLHQFRPVSEFVNTPVRLNFYATQGITDSRLNSKFFGFYFEYFSTNYFSPASLSLRNLNCTSKFGIWEKKKWDFKIFVQEDLKDEWIYIEIRVKLLFARIGIARTIWRAKSYLENGDKGFVSMDRQIESFNDRLLGVGLSRFHCLGYNKRHKWIAI